MMFAHEDILNQKPISWFPGMAGASEPCKEKEDSKSGKSDWNRFESQASTVPPDPAEQYLRSISCDSSESAGHKAHQAEEEETSEDAKVILYQEEYDDESRFLLRDFGFGGSLSSWAQELVGSAGLVVSVSFVLLVVLALASPLSSTASWMCFGAVRVMIVLTFLSGLFMLQAPQPAKAMPEVSPYTTEEASD
ncbi:unnamed protein product [Symbiodinium pilosum]|uniref:Uncharacterized protein n=1 Tax=Symbiodinium pilosum TaxID=2952 RepID=A0A812XI84_SYMPI|nr:unnamed protein product [Symbiodinium pilosum]